MTHPIVAKSEIRPRKLLHGPLDFEPTNELGVVYLFSYLASRKYGLDVEKVGAGFPDCTAVRRATGKRVRIEFEFKSRSFASHGHDHRKCDWIVCWIHNWGEVPKGLEVKELRRHFGLGFNVWVVPVAGDYAERLPELNRANWSVPRQASKGDLLLYYRTTPHKQVSEIFALTSDVVYTTAQWKKGKDFFGEIRRLGRMPRPVHLEELKRHRILKDAGFVRGGMRARSRVSADWPALHEMIISLNPSLKRVLAPFGPDRV